MDQTDTTYSTWEADEVDFDYDSEDDSASSAADDSDDHSGSDDEATERDGEVDGAESGDTAESRRIAKQTAILFQAEAYTGSVINDYIATSPAATSEEAQLAATYASHKLQPANLVEPTVVAPAAHPSKVIATATTYEPTSTPTSALFKVSADAKAPQWVPLSTTEPAVVDAPAATTTPAADASYVSYKKYAAAETTVATTESAVTTAEPAVAVTEPVTAVTGPTFASKKYIDAPAISTTTTTPADVSYLPYKKYAAAETTAATTEPAIPTAEPAVAVTESGFISPKKVVVTAEAGPATETPSTYKIYKTETAAADTGYVPPVKVVSAADTTSFVSPTKVVASELSAVYPNKIASETTAIETQPLTEKLTKLAYAAPQGGVEPVVAAADYKIIATPQVTEVRPAPSVQPIPAVQPIQPIQVVQPLQVLQPIQTASETLVHPLQTAELRTIHAGADVQVVHPLPTPETRPAQIVQPLQTAQHVPPVSEVLQLRVAQPSQPTSRPMEVSSPQAQRPVVAAQPEVLQIRPVTAPSVTQPPAAPMIAWTSNPASSAVRARVSDDNTTLRTTASAPTSVRTEVQPIMPVATARAATTTVASVIESAVVAPRMAAVTSDAVLARNSSILQSSAMTGLAARDANLPMMSAVAGRNTESTTSRAAASVIPGQITMDAVRAGFSGKLVAEGATTKLSADGKPMATMISADGKMVAASSSVAGSTRDSSITINGATRHGVSGAGDATLHDKLCTCSSTDKCPMCLSMTSALRLASDESHKMLAIELALIAMVAVSAIAKDKGAGQEPTAAVERNKHLVVKGDTLDSIAEFYFGDANVGWLIAELNMGCTKQTFADGKLIVEIFENTQLQLPVWNELRKFYAEPVARPAKGLVTIIVCTLTERPALDALASVITAGISQHLPNYTQPHAQYE